MSLRNVIIISSILFLLLVGIVIFIIWYVKEISRWIVNSWMIESNTTSANILSVCSSGKNMCVSDAILAYKDNQYNSSASVVYLSNDSGKTFELEVFKINNLQVYAISDDGNTIVGISQDLSNNQTGVWMSSDGNTTWQQISMILSQEQSIQMHMPYGIAMDKSATYLCVCGNDNDGIWYSDDSGKTWNESNAPHGQWLSIIMSTDVDSTTGIPLLTSAMFSGDSSGNLVPDIYYSKDGGITWTPSITLSLLLLQDTENNNDNVSLTNHKRGYNHASPVMGFAYQSMSSNGKYQSIIVNTTIYISYDYGTTWKISITDTEVLDWCSISVSADGKTQVLCSNTNGVYESIDYGITWTQNVSLLEVDNVNIDNIDGTNTYWINASLFDGGIFACTYNFFYYKYFNTKSTLLFISIIALSFIFIILLSCAIYFKWFVIHSNIQTNTTIKDETINPSSKFSETVTPNSIIANANKSTNTTITGTIINNKLE